MGIGADLRAIEGVSDCGDDLLCVTRTFRRGRGTFKNLGSGDSFLLHRTQAPSEDRLGDRWCGNTHVEGVDGGPFPGPLLAGRIHYDVYEGFARAGIVLLEDIPCYLNEKGV